MAKYLHCFPRSDYQVALHSYRKARRRGDAAEAQRWLKAADMHLRLADRFDEGVHRSMMRDEERARSRPAKPENQEKKEISPRQQLDNLISRATADILAAHARKQTQA